MNDETASDSPSPNADDPADCATNLHDINDATRTSKEDGAAAVPPAASLSKNQQKKMRRLERMKLKCQRRKEQEKQLKHEKAKAQGRDIDQERQLMEQNRDKGEGRLRRQLYWEQQILPLAQASFRICLDCSFTDLLTPKEMHSLALQIRYCYSSNNQRNIKPCFFTVSSLSGETLKELQNVSGFDTWTKNRPTFSHTPDSFEKYYGPDQLQNLVYLTSDSDNVLTELNNSHIYVIGGIVDRNRLKGATYRRAQALGIQTAKLPLATYFPDQKMATSRVLTCNHVFDILLQYRAHDNDWLAALQAVLPQRKFAAPEAKDETVASLVITTQPEERNLASGVKRPRISADSITAEQKNCQEQPEEKLAV
jgi:tRNA (guanine9-N1)-methyltransferase